MNQSLEERLDAIRNHPLHRQLGLHQLEATAGRAELSARIAGKSTLNPAGVMHGGVLYVLSDVAAYAATLSMLDPSEEAVTHDLHISVLRGSSSGAEIALSAQVLRRGRKLVFIQVQAHADDHLLATATVTKSVIAR